MDRKRLFTLLALLLPLIGFSQWVPHLDSTFGSIGTVPYESRDLALLPGNGILSCDGQYLRRMDQWGVLDPSFGTNGQVTDVGENFALEVQADGKTVTAGKMGGQAFLARYLSSGAIDNSFGTNGWVGLDADTQDDWFSEMTVLGDGKILAAGISIYLQNPSYRRQLLVARFNADGSLDSTFGVGGQMVHLFGFDATLGKMLVQSDGKILLAGSAMFGGDSLPRFYLARLEQNGPLDMSFGGTGLLTPALSGVLGGYVSGMALQTDGKTIIVGGYRDSTLFYDKVLMGRFLSNGTADPSFGNGGYVLDAICPTTSMEALNEIILQADGKILVGGNMFRGCDNILGYGIAVSLLRFLNDGTLDPSFQKQSLGIHTTFGDARTASLLLQPDGKILLGANLTRTFEMDPDEYHFMTARFIPDTVIVTGIEETQLGFQVFPNPVVENRFHIQGDPGLSGALSLQLFDVHGRMVQSFFERGNVQTLTQQPFELDAALAGGVYFLRLGNDREMKTMRLVKM